MVSWLCPFSLRGSCETGVHEPAVSCSDSSNTNSELVAGQVISNSFLAVNRIVSGGGNTWKETVLVTLPFGVTRVIGPDRASNGTTAVMRRSMLLVRALVKLALAPLKRTLVAPVKLVPMRVTFAPEMALAGENGVPVNPGDGVGYQVSLTLPPWVGSNALLLATATE